MRLTVSIVTFRSDPILFAGTLQSLCASVGYAKDVFPDLSCELRIIENDRYERRNFKQLEGLLKTRNWDVFDDVIIKVASSNLGYGRGHNLALYDSLSDFHLVLNPDVSLDAKAISQGLAYLLGDPETVLVSPGVEDAEGSPLYLCKQFPRVFDLLLRGFAPVRVQHLFEPRLARYEMRSLARQSGPVRDIKIVSGCCMLIRTETFKKAGGFDVKFFLYFEDFDLSLRLAKLGLVTYLPSMKIIHYGGHAAKKGWKHILLFASSGLKFYRRYGWRWY